MLGSLERMLERSSRGSSSLTSGKIPPEEALGGEQPEIERQHRHCNSDKLLASFLVTSYKLHINFLQASNGLLTNF